MTSEDLTPEQCEDLRVRVARQLRFLNRLTERMNRLGWPPADPVKQAAEEARARMMDLHVAIHYASCSHGVGREEKRE